MVNRKRSIGAFFTAFILIQGCQSSDSTLTSSSAPSPTEWRNYAWSDWGAHTKSNNGDHDPEYLLVDLMDPLPGKSGADTQSELDRLKGKHPDAEFICYMTVGSIEKYRTDAGNGLNVWDELKHDCTSPYHGTNSADEKSCEGKDQSILPIMKDWIDQIAEFGECEGVEFDNMDLLNPKTSNKLADYAKGKGLKVALKNDFSSVKKGKLDLDLFDYWVMERCMEFKHDGTNYGCQLAESFREGSDKPVFAVEYGTHNRWKACNKDKIVNQGLNFHFETGGTFRTCD